MTTKRGGKAGWPAGSGSGGSSVWLEDFIWPVVNQFDGLPSETQGWGTAGLVMELYRINTSSDEIPWHWAPPPNWIDTEVIQMYFYGASRFVGSPGPHTLRIFSRWHGQGDNPDVAYSNSTDFTATLTATSRIWTTSRQTISPDGTFAADDMLLGKLSRTDSGSDNPFLLGAKIRYKVSL